MQKNLYIINNQYITIFPLRSLFNPAIHVLLRTLNLKVLNELCLSQ